MELSFKTIALFVVAALVIFVVVALIKFNIKRVHVIRCAREASDLQLDHVYQLLDGLGPERPVCAVLARTNRTGPADAFLIPLPGYVEPWGGRVITVENKRDPSLHFCNAQASEPVLNGKVFRLVPVPRQKTNSGKGRNQFSPKSYLSSNPQLPQALRTICPKYPAETLSYLLQSGAETFEFDPMFQARIGGSPAWLQDAEFQNCDICKKRMSLILQLPGSLLPGKPLPRGTFFFFGCTTHHDQFKSVAQFT